MSSMAIMYQSKIINNGINGVMASAASMAQLINGIESGENINVIIMA
jgi:hypothetical protein